jgi:hypothetical protein
MPGAKRKCDEDTWIVTQSKKFKCGTLLSNVYGKRNLKFLLGVGHFEISLLFLILGEPIR